MRYLQSQAQRGGKKAAQLREVQGMPLLPSLLNHDFVLYNATQGTGNGAWALMCVFMPDVAPFRAYPTNGAEGTPPPPPHLVPPQI